MVLTIFSASLVAYAMNADGFPTHKAELNDGGVWVASQKFGAIGRQNVPVGQLDAQFAPSKAGPNSPLDVVQNAAAVVAVSNAGSSLVPVDVATGLPVKDGEVSVSGKTLMGGKVLSVVDPNDGRVWATTVDPAVGVSAISALGSDVKPIASMGSKSVATVSVNGTILGASSDSGQLTTIRSGSNGIGKQSTRKLPAVPDGDLAEIAAVGETPVLLSKDGSLAVGSRTLNVGPGAHLQQAGPGSDEVLVSTPTELLAVNLEEGSRRTVASSGVNATAFAPLRFNGCSYAAWAAGAQATVVAVCGGRAVEKQTLSGLGATSNLVFRTNRNQLALNDTVRGLVWRVQDGAWERIDDWQSPDDDVAENPEKPDESTQDQNTPPQAKDDKLGARVGQSGTRTTTLHVLDNDTSPVQSVLAVVALDTKSLPSGLKISIAPDQQSLLAVVSPGVEPREYQFRYTVNDGSTRKQPQGDATVRLTVRADAGSAKPVLRENFEKSKAKVQYAVVGGGSINIPVTQDWRDPEYGDPVVVKSATTDRGRVEITPQGLIRFTAGKFQGRVRDDTISYVVTTGGKSSDAEPRTVQVSVAGSDILAPKALPDVSSGEVGSVVVIKPLDNDVAGADPTDESAHLEIAGDVAPRGGWQVQTDREAGTIRVTPKSVGNQTFQYSLGYGNATRVTGSVRVIAKSPKAGSDEPVPGPDFSTLRGSSPATVDVLANDFDPKGRLLAVTSATATSDRIDVAIIEGRWLRVSSQDPSLRPTTQQVTYTVSNGSSDAKGSLALTLADALDSVDATPITQPDQALVRAGDVVSIPVLDNDSTPTGDPIDLAPTDTDEVPSGEYEVLEGIGRAYVSGRRVQYVPPATVDGPIKVRIAYVVKNSAVSDANSATELAYVRITPSTAPNEAPIARAIEGRVVQGDTVLLKLPASGLDPDGDSVSISSIGDVEGGSPRLGRIVSYGADTIQYQAYPGQEGTDSFGYTITDRLGKSSQGTVRVAVTPPGAPQPPVAINDSVTADLGREVEIDVLANDLRSAGTRLHVEELDPQDGVELDPATNLITVKTPSKAGDSVRVPYFASNGIDESAGELVVTAQKGFNNPPVATDVYATPEASSATVKVDVLSHVFDIDGRSKDLKIIEVLGTDATPQGGSIELPVKDGEAQVLPYRVEDGDGGSAVAVIHVPARPKDFPYLKPGSAIKLDKGQSKSFDLAEFVVDPEGDPVVLTTVGPRSLYAAPQDHLAVTPKEKTTVVLKAGNQDGPGSLTFTVSDRAALADEEAHVSMLTVPVQVGSDAPVISCPDPESPIEVAEGGGRIDVDVAAVCHVWTADPSAAVDLEFTAKFAQQPKGAKLEDVERGFRLSTSTETRAGMTGTIAVGVKGSDQTSLLGVRVTKVDPPTLAAIEADARAGEPLTIKLAGKVRSGIDRSKWDIQVLSVDPVKGPALAWTSDGPNLTVTPPKDESGPTSYNVVISDVGQNPGNRPTATGRLRLLVAARPNAPTGLTAVGDTQPNKVKLDWVVPEANGARIDHYRVTYSGPSEGTQQCAGPKACVIKNLKNGKPYTFTVAAHNKVEYSEESNTASATPDQPTGAPRNLKVLSQGDAFVKFGWEPPVRCDCSAVKAYRVTWTGHGKTEDIDGLTKTATGLANGESIKFTVIAVNGDGTDEFTSIPAEISGIASGKPDTPGKPTFSLDNRGGGSGKDRKAVTVISNQVAANGSKPVQYQFTRGDQVICAWQESQECSEDLPNNGAQVSYQVQARNKEAADPKPEDPQDSHVSGKSPAGSIVVAATPDTPTIDSFEATGKDNEVQFTFTAGKSYGLKNTVECKVTNGSCADQSFGDDGGSSGTKKVTGPANGATATLQLRACNGSPGSGPGDSECSPWTSATTTPYGPIRQPSINVDGSGQTINGSYSWDANGKSANVRVTRNDGHVVADFNSANASTNSISEFVDYSRSFTYTITVSDPGRETKSASDGASTPNPPPVRKVTVTKGSDCGGGGGPGCGGTCTNRSCAKIGVTLENFSGPATCSVDSNASGPPFPNRSASNGYSEPGWFMGFPGKWVQVTCDGVVSNQFFWPND